MKYMNKTFGIPIFDPNCLKNIGIINEKFLNLRICSFTLFILFYNFSLKIKHDLKIK